MTVLEVLVVVAKRRLINSENVGYENKHVVIYLSNGWRIRI